MNPEEITKSVNAAFDSVNLINELQAKTTLTEEEQATVSRNVEHLKIMMSKDWFSEALTEEQALSINELI